MGEGFPALEDSFPPSMATLLPYLPLANVDGNAWTNSREMCLSVARRINKGSRFVFQEPRSSLKAISQLRNETPETAQEPKYFGLMQTVISQGLQATAGTRGTLCGHKDSLLKAFETLKMLPA